MSKIVIYHGGCSDGFCAAYLCWKCWGDTCEYIPVNYGEAPPIVDGKDVLIVDFSYKRSVLEEMKAKANSLMVLDHHKTAQAELANLDYCVFDMNKSGGRLTWEYLWDQKALPVRFSTFARDFPPRIVTFTEDRDLWKWELPDSKVINAAIRSYPYDFLVWDKFSDYQYWMNLVYEGRGILRIQELVVKQHVDKAIETEISGYRVLAVNATTMMSEIGEVLAKDRPFGATWFDDGKGNRIWSLRSREDGIDVSEVAKKFGGGGHKAAAGFKLEIRD